jgi:probable rRNA maturation factor
MSLVVDVTADGIRSPLGTARIKDVALGVLKAEKVRNALVSIALVSPARISQLNKRHLSHRGPTDVISFSLGATPGGSRGAAIVGDIYIAPDVARENAHRFGIGVREEITRLVVHGTLHVLGHDHPDGEARTASPMWRRQERLLAKLSRTKRRSAAG